MSHRPCPRLCQVSYRPYRPCPRLCISKGQVRPRRCSQMQLALPSLHLFCSCLCSQRVGGRNLAVEGWGIRSGTSPDALDGDPPALPSCAPSTCVFLSLPITPSRCLSLPLLPVVASLSSRCLAADFMWPAATSKAPPSARARHGSQHGS